MTLVKDTLDILDTIKKCFILLFSLSKLTQLQELDLSNDPFSSSSINNFSSGSISVIGDMTSLIKLDLSSYGLTELPQR